MSPDVTLIGQQIDVSRGAHMPVHEADVGQLVVTRGRLVRTGHDEPIEVNWTMDVVDGSADVSVLNRRPDLGVRYQANLAGALPLAEPQMKWRRQVAEHDVSD